MRTREDTSAWALRDVLYAQAAGCVSKYWIGTVADAAYAMLLVSASAQSRCTTENLLFRQWI